MSPWWSLWVKRGNKKWILCASSFFWKTGTGFFLPFFWSYLHKMEVTSNSTHFLKFTSSHKDLVIIWHSWSLETSKLQTKRRQSFKCYVIINAITQNVYCWFLSVWPINILRQLYLEQLKITYQRNGVVWEVWGKESDLLGSHCHAPKLCLWLELFIVRFTYRKRFTNQALKGITNRRINRETKRYFLPFTEL